MADIAFHGDPAIKAQALERLRRHIAAGSFVYFPAWEDGKANVIGVVVEADDTPRFAESLGYPISLAETLPMLVNGFRPRDEASAFAEAWLERTPVGADLTRIVPLLVLALLDHPILGEMTRRHAAVEESRQAVMALHQRVIDGEEPDRKAWKSARMAAIAATDAIGDAPLDRLAANVVEAAAWPATMRTVLRDTLHTRGSLYLRLLLAEHGWTEQDESRVFQIRQKAEEDGYKAELSGLDRVLAILDADHPVLASGFRMRNERMEEASAIYRSIGWQAIDLMERAPITAPDCRPVGARA